MIAFLRFVFTTRPVVISNAAGLGLSLGFYLVFAPDRSVAGVIAGTAGTVFALIAGAGVPLLHSATDRRIEYWPDAVRSNRDTPQRALRDLEALLKDLGVVVVAAFYLLVALMLAITVAYTDSIKPTPQRAILATAFGLLGVGLLLTAFFVLSAARIQSIQTLQKTFRGPLPDREVVSARPTFGDIDALVGPATPHFACQLRARVEELIEALPEDDPVRRYGQEKMEFLERLAYASSKAEEGSREPRTRPGWEKIPSSSPIAPPPTAG